MSKVIKPLSIDTALIKHAEAIRELGKRTIANVIEIGRRLAECKRLTNHGCWLQWLDHEFGWEERTAQRFIQVHEFAREDFKSDKLSDLDIGVSTLYMLAAPSTPKAARTKIVERAKAGERLPVAEVKRVIEGAKGRKKKRRTPDDFVRESKEKKAAADRDQNILDTVFPEIFGGKKDLGREQEKAEAVIHVPTTHSSIQLPVLVAVPPTPTQAGLDGSPVTDPAMAAEWKEAADIAGIELDPEQIDRQVDQARSAYIAATKSFTPAEYERELIRLAKIWGFYPGELIRREKPNGR